MDQKLQPILDFLMRPAVEYNLPQNKYWGIAIGESSIMVASGFFMIEITNIKFDKKPEGGFFSYFEHKFTDFSYPLNPVQITEKVNSQCKFVGKVTFPLTDIHNRLLDIDKQTSLKKCRIVVSQGYLESGELTLKFSNNGNGWEFRHPQLEKPIILHRDSVIKSDGIRKDVVYRCILAGESDSAILVNAIEPYGEMRMGILYSPNGFVPTNIEEINRMTGVIPPDMIVCSNVTEPKKIPSPPIHLDGSMMFDLLKVFLLSSDKVEIHLPDDPNKPVMLTNVKRGEDDLDIRVVVSTLNPFFGAQRR